MARTARAAVAVAPGVTEIRDLPVPEVTPTTGLLRVEVTGVCGSDWGYYHDLVRARGPVVLGHETVGTIERAGREARFETADRARVVAAVEAHEARQPEHVGIAGALPEQAARCAFGILHAQLEEGALRLGELVCASARGRVEREHDAREREGDASHRSSSS